jgi:hypothetical protein
VSGIANDAGSLGMHEGTNGDRTAMGFVHSWHLGSSWGTCIEEQLPPSLALGPCRPTGLGGWWGLSEALEPPATEESQLYHLKKTDVSGCWVWWVWRVRFDDAPGFAAGVPVDIFARVGRDSPGRAHSRPPHRPISRRMVAPHDNALGEGRDGLPSGLSSWMPHGGKLRGSGGAENRFRTLSSSPSH